MACDAAAQFERLGLRHGARTAVLGRKSPETIALVLACLLTGRPVLLPSVDLDPAVVQTLLRQAAVDHALAAEPFDGADVVRPSREAVAGDPVGPTCVPGVDDVALMLATSGSTGLPKVVPIKHGAILRFASWASDRFDIGPGTNVLSYCGLNFDLSILEVWTTLLHGGCAVLVAHDKAARPDHLLDLVLRHEVNVVQGVPMLLGLLLDAADARGCALPSVAHTVLTGDAASMTLLARLPGPFEHSRLYNVYGCTETNDSFIHVIDVQRELRRGAIPLGDPLPGVSALIVHDGRMIEGPGSGELWVSTPFQANGYLGRRSLDDGFAPPPEAQAGGHYFRSRDLVRRDASGTAVPGGANRRPGEGPWRSGEPPRGRAGATDRPRRRRGGRRRSRRRTRRQAPDRGRAPPARGRAEHGGLRARCAKDLGRIAVPAIIEFKTTHCPRPRQARWTAARCGQLPDRRRMSTTTRSRSSSSTSSPRTSIRPSSTRIRPARGRDRRQPRPTDDRGLDRGSLRGPVDAGEIGEDDLRSVRAVCSLIERLDGSRPLGGPAAKPAIAVHEAVRMLLAGDRPVERGDLELVLGAPPRGGEAERRADAVALLEALRDAGCPTTDRSAR